MRLPLTGLKFLYKNRGLKRYAVLPLLFNILLYVLVLALLFWLLARWQIGAVAWDFWGPVGGWLAAAVNWTSWILKAAVGLAALAVTFFSFTAVGMVLASPLNDLLSEKVEAAYAGTEKKLSLPLRLTLRATLNSMLGSLLTALRQLVCSLAALPFLLIPVIGFLPIFMVGAYFSGFGYIDSAMARNFLRPRHKKLLTDGNFWKIAGFGTGMQFLFFIPFTGLLLMPVGVTAGTIFYCDGNWTSLFQRSGVAPPIGFQVPTRRGDSETCEGKSP
ncbi:MAG: EI24 domain-containing protein [Planctomycetota bacterium]|nr:EI24 domain-containing protein [Planctomycetota bacterium]